MAPQRSDCKRADLPNGFILLEGNRRVAMAKALERCRTLGTNLPVWVLRYPPQ
jgi:hypothetical protein